MAEELIKDNQPEAQPENKPSKGSRFKASVKEWFRKKIVALKIRPHVIPLIVLLITSVVFMLSLYKYSIAIYASFDVEATSATGICIFVTTLLSLLVLVSFLNAFPKRKKPNIFFIVLVGVMIAAMIACDLVYYIQMENCMEQQTSLATDINPAQPLALAHVILLGVSSVVFALLPAYTILIRKIDTSIKVDSATEHMGEKIDIEEDD